MHGSARQVNQLRPRLQVQNPSPHSSTQTPIFHAPQVFSTSPWTENQNQSPQHLRLVSLSSSSVIALDVDDVLLDYTGGFRCFFQDHFPQRTVPNDRELQSIAADLSSPLRKAYLQSSIFDDLPVIAGALDAVNRLHKAGHRLEAVTSRPSHLQHVTQASLDKKFLGMISNIHYTNGQPKGRSCQRLGAWLLVDDSIVNVCEVSAHGISAVLFGDFSSNHLVSSLLCESQSLPPNVVHLHHWADTVDWIMKNGPSLSPNSRPLAVASNHSHHNMFHMPKAKLDLEEKDEVDAEISESASRPPMEELEIFESALKNCVKERNSKERNFKDRPELTCNEKSKTKQINLQHAEISVARSGGSWIIGSSCVNLMQTAVTAWRQAWLEAKAGRLQRAWAQRIASRDRMLLNPWMLLRSFERQSRFLSLMKCTFAWHRAFVAAQADRLYRACEQALTSRDRTMQYFLTERSPMSLSSPMSGFCRYTYQMLLAMSLCVWRARLEDSLAQDQYEVITNLFTQPNQETDSSYLLAAELMKLRNENEVLKATKFQERFQKAQDEAAKLEKLRNANELDKLRNEIVVLKLQEEEQKKLQSQLEEKCTGLQVKLEQAAEFLTKEATSLPELKKLRDENKLLKVQNEDRNKLQKPLEKTNTRLQAGLEAAEFEDATESDLLADLEKLRNDNTHLKVQNEDWKAKNKHLKVQNEDLKFQNANKLERKFALQADSEKANEADFFAKLQKLQSEIRLSNVQKGDRNKLHKQLEKTFTQLRAELASEVEQARDVNLLGKLEKLQVENEFLKMQREDRSDVQKQVELQAELEKAKVLIVELLAELERVKNEHQLLKAKESQAELEKAKEVELLDELERVSNEYQLLKAKESQAELKKEKEVELLAELENVKNDNHLLKAKELQAELQKEKEVELLAELERVKNDNQLLKAKELQAELDHKVELLAELENVKNKNQLLKAKELQAELKREKEVELLAELENVKNDNQLLKAKELEAELKKATEVELLAELERVKNENQFLKAKELQAELKKEKEVELLAELENVKNENQLVKAKELEQSWQAELKKEKEVELLAELERVNNENHLLKAKESQAELKREKEVQLLAELENVKNDNQLLKAKELQAELEKAMEVELLAELENVKKAKDLQAELKKEKEVELLAELERVKNDNQLLKANELQAELEKAKAAAVLAELEKVKNENQLLKAKKEDQKQLERQAEVEKAKEAELEKLRNDNEHLKVQKEDQSKLQKQLKKECSRVQEELAAAKAAALRAELQKLKRENGLLTVQNQDHNKLQKQLNQTCTNLQAELEKANASISKLTIENQLLADECSMLKINFHAANAERASREVADH